jgi:hypothetical protein
VVTVWKEEVKKKKSNDLITTLNYNYYKYFSLPKLPSSHTTFFKKVVYVSVKVLLFLVFYSSSCERV